MLRKLQFAALVISLAGLTVSCGSATRNENRGSETVVPANLVTIHAETVPDYYEAIGTVEAKATSVVGAQVAATVLRVMVQPGDRVRQGEMLALLDDREEMAQLNSARAGAEAAQEGRAELQHALAGAMAEAAMAKITLRRYQGLWAESSVSRQELDEATTRYKGAAARVAALEAQIRQEADSARQAQSEEDAARTMLSYTRITSPINGIVTVKNVDAGTLVMPGTPLFTVEDASQYRLVVSVPARYQFLVGMGETIRVVVGRSEARARVTEIVPAADPASRTFTVKLALPATYPYHSGDYGTASIPVGQRQGVFVPKTAVIEQGELAGVFVIDSGNVAHYRLIKTGRTRVGQVEILSGLAPGERIAVSGVDKMKEGDRVEAQ